MHRRWHFFPLHLGLPSNKVDEVKHVIAINLGNSAGKIFRNVDVSEMVIRAQDKPLIPLIWQCDRPKPSLSHLEHVWCISRWAWTLGLYQNNYFRQWLGRIKAGYVLTLKLMDGVFLWLSSCGNVGHLHFPRPIHHKVCGFVLWRSQRKIHKMQSY